MSYREPPRSPTKEILLAYAAPAVLLSVACIQLLLATTASLSPWKGGGFGMFSTVDAPSARFLRVYLVGEDEPAPVLLPGSLSRLVREVRTVPRAGLLRELARTVAEGTWVRYTMSPAVRRYKALLERGASTLADVEEPVRSDGQTSDSIRPYVSFDEIRFLRMATELETPSPSQVFSFREVRAELWRFEFDGSSLQLVAEPMLQVTVPRRPQGP